MKTSCYLFDFKNIVNPSGIQDCLKHWTIKQLSNRAFEVTGREYTRADLIRLHQFIGKDGHIFVYDFENQHEFFYQKHPRGRMQERARDSDLDTQTLHRIEEFLADQPD